MMLAMAVVVAPGARAYSKATWQAAFAGTTAIPCARFPSVCLFFGIPTTSTISNGFWGWCDFVGVSTGTGGDCEVSNYFHISGLVSVTCTTSIDVTGWTTGPSTFFPPPPLGFFITSATVTNSPSSVVCNGLFPPGAFSAPPALDTGIPAAAIHFNTNQALFTMPGQFQVTVTQVFAT